MAPETTIVHGSLAVHQSVSLRPTTLIGALVIACWISIGAPASLHAEGTQTGVLSGIVVGPDGNALAAADVQLRGTRTQRSTLTDGQGSFRFPGLEVGPYTLDVALLDLETSLADVWIHIDQTTEVTVALAPEGEELPVATIEDTLQVVALAPLINRYDTSVSTRVSYAFLDKLPAERLYQSVAQLLPGVAGNDPGNPNVSGALRGSNLYLVDGIDTTDSTTGLFGLNLGYDSVEEVEVTTAAPPVEYGRVSGAVINVVTQSGRDRFSGRLRWLARSPDWTDDFEDDAAHLQPELDAANRDGSDLDNTISITAGGPLVPERLWFTTGFEHEEGTFLRPTLFSQIWDEGTEIENAAFKVDARLNDSQSLTGQFLIDEATFATFPQPFEIAAGENRAGQVPAQLMGSFVEPLPGDLLALSAREQEGDFARLQWLAVLSSNLSLSATLASQNRTLARRALNRSPITGGAAHFASPPQRQDQFAVFNGPTTEGDEERRRDQANVSLEWFLRAGKLEHELSIGADFQRTVSRSSLQVPGLANIDRLSGRPAVGQIFFDFDTSDACFFEDDCTDFDPATGLFGPSSLFNFFARPQRETELETAAVFVNDTVQAGRWLFSFGLRAESVRAEDDRGLRLAEDTSIAPRFSVKLDPNGDGKFLLSASWSRLIEPFSQQFIDSFIRDDPFSGFSAYTWDPLFDDACIGADPSDLDSPCWFADFESPLFPIQFGAPNLDLERSKVDEWVVSIERQLTETASLRVSYIDRTWRDLWDDRLLLDSDGFAFGRVENVPEARRSYRALQLVVQRHLARRWQLLAAYTFAEAEGNLFQNDGFSTFLDFADVTDVNVANRFGLAPFDREQELKIFSHYNHQVGPVRLSYGGAFRYQTGAPFQRERLDDDGFGVRFVEPRGSRQLEDTTELDLSVAAEIPLTALTGIELRLEVFNATNEVARIGVETLEDSGRAELPRTIADLQRPRRFRFTLGFRF